MRRIEVRSSVLAAVGYADGVLEVEFVHGSVYQYFDVPPRVHSALLAAPSHGTYFNDHVKDTYRYARVS